MAPHYVFDFDAVHHIVADAVGEPGNRTFLLQARQGSRLVTLILEKEQVAALAASVLELLEDVEARYPDRTTSSEVPPQALHLEEPIRPAFRVGQMGLGYDEDLDRVVLVLQALPSREDEPEADLPRARFYATRAQMRALSEHALEVVARGRPLCPLCGEPIDPDGHFCPRTNGHAFPLFL